MHDIRLIRENPGAFDAGLARRSLEPRASELLALDDRRKATIAELQRSQERRNSASKRSARRWPRRTRRSPKR